MDRENLLLLYMGSIYYKLGNGVEELQMYRQAKGVYKEETRKNIGTMILAERGDYDEAIGFCRRQVEMSLVHTILANSSLSDWSTNDPQFNFTLAEYEFNVLVLRHVGRRSKMMFGDRSHNFSRKQK